MSLKERSNFFPDSYFYSATYYLFQKRSYKEIIRKPLLPTNIRDFRDFQEEILKLRKKSSKIFLGFTQNGSIL